VSLFHTQVTLDGYAFEDFDFTVLLATGINEITPGSWSAEYGLTYANQVGLALAWDGTNPNQMRLAIGGDEISGRLKSIENRVIEGHNVGVASFKFADLMPVDTGATGGAVPVVGSRVKGGSVAGSVQACAGTEAFLANAPRVVELRTVSGVAYAVVVKF
jgi:hypothetical protein